jgi:hypothetical protein
VVPARAPDAGYGDVSIRTTDLNVVAIRPMMPFVFDRQVALVYPALPGSAAASRSARASAVRECWSAVGVSRIDLVMALAASGPASGLVDLSVSRAMLPAAVERRGVGVVPDGSSEQEQAGSPCPRGERRGHDAGWSGRE